MAGRIQNEDMKSETDITGAGGTQSQLTNDTKIYVTANSLNKRLDQAITNGDFSGSNLTFVATKTTTYTANWGEAVPVDGSSAGFTVNITTAVGHTGQQILIYRVDQTLANNVTIDPNGAQTIDGVSTKPLSTQREAFRITSDGTNVIVMDHKIYSFWTAYTPTFTAFGTVSTSDFWWRRVGDSVEVMGSWTNGTVTSAEARISLPSGLTTDTFTGIKVAGSMRNSNTATSGECGVLIESGVTYFTINRHNGVGGLDKSPGNAFNNGENNSFQAKVGISAWEG